MKLKRDIIWFDLETTGVNTEEARIVEIACIKIKVDGSTEKKELLINPTIPIPVEASEVHGITDEKVKDAPTFKKVSASMRVWFEGCDLGGYNSNSYDIPLLSAEFVRAGLEPINWEPNLFDVMQLYRHLYPNTLSDVYKRLTGKELEGAHSALIDVEGTIEISEVLMSQLEVVEDVEGVDLMLQADKKRVDLASKMYKDSEGIVRWNFSKNKDLPVKKGDSFNNWFMNQDFPLESKDKLKETLDNL